MKYFDTRHYEPLKTPADVALVAEIFAGAPRGGTAINCCAYCVRAAENKRLRTCGSCGLHYCGRRGCRLAHSFKCSPYRPHWKGLPKKSAAGFYNGFTGESNLTEDD